MFTIRSIKQNANTGKFRTFFPGKSNNIFDLIPRDD